MAVEDTSDLPLKVEELKIADEPDNASDDEEQEFAQLSATLADLLQRSKTLVEELDILYAYLKKIKKQDTFEFRQYKASVLTEVKALQKLSGASNSLARLRNMVNCSNFPHIEAVWHAAKRSKGLLSLKRNNSLVDIVADSGLEWIKVSLTNETRLLFEMAKQGWRNDVSSDSEDEWDNYGDEDPDKSQDQAGNDGQLEFIKMAEKLSKEAQKTRVRYRHPRVTFVFPRMVENRVPEIDNILRDMRATGVTVLCADDLEPAPPVTDVLEKLAINEFENFTSSLNIDCTILLGLVSDISHGHVPEQPWFNRAVRRQIQVEESQRLLPDTLWPAMNGRELFCTQDAAKRMREIVDLIGTDTEKARTKIMMGDDKTKGKDQLINDFQVYSDHPVPNGWHLPIQIVDTPVESLLSSPALPEVAAAVAPHLSAINQSVFYFGWSSGYTTLTSNRTVLKQIESLVEENRKTDDEAGPNVWLSTASRSLVAKEKDRKGM